MLCDFFWSDICTRKVKQSIKALSLVIHLPDRRSQSCKTVMMIVKVILILSLATLSMARCRGIRCVFKSEETRWKTPLILTTIVIVFAILYCHCHHPLLVIVLKRNDLRTQNWHHCSFVPHGNSTRFFDNQLHSYRRETCGFLLRCNTATERKMLRLMKNKQTNRECWQNYIFVQVIKPVQRLGSAADQRLYLEEHLLKNWKPHANWSDGRDHLHHQDDDWKQSGLLIL